MRDLEPAGVAGILATLLAFPGSKIVEHPPGLHEAMAELVARRLAQIRRDADERPDDRPGDRPAGGAA